MSKFAVVPNFEHPVLHLGNRRVKGESNRDKLGATNMAYTGRIIRQVMALYLLKKKKKKKKKKI